MRERAPWYRRASGLERIAVGLVVASAATGFLAPASTSWRTLQLLAVAARRPAHLAA